MALTLAGVALFVVLGIWQLHRATWKEQLIARFDAAANASLVPFTKVDLDSSGDQYPHVGVRGHFVSGRRYLRDNQTNAGRAGVEVYAPFAVQGESRRLLVDQGFLPRTRTSDLPHLPPLPKGETRVTGLYATAPPNGLEMGGNQLPDQNAWPKTTIYIDLDEIGADLNHELFPRVLLSDKDASLPYVRDWSPHTMPPSRHRAYALQWFSFALAAIVIFLVMHRRRRSSSDEVMPDE